MTDTTESVSGKATRAVKLMEADNATVADYVLISSISSNMNTDVVGGLKNILNQQGGKFGSYTPRATSSKTDIDNFAATNNSTASNPQTSPTNNNSTSTTTDTSTASTATDTKQNPPVKSTRGITGGDVIVAAIDLSLKSGGGIAAIAGAFSYKSEAGARIEDVVADIKDLQSAAKTTPIKIYLVMNNGKKSKNDIGKITNGVFQVSASQAKIILNAFKPNIDVNKQYFGNGKRVKGKDLLAALESNQDLK